MLNLYSINVQLMAINGELYLPNIWTYLFQINAHRNELMFIKCPLPEHIESITAKRRQKDGKKTAKRRKRYEGNSTLHRDTPLPPLEPYKERKCCPVYAGVPACYYWGRRRLACGQIRTNCLAMPNCPGTQASPPAKKTTFPKSSIASEHLPP